MAAGNFLGNLSNIFGGGGSSAIVHNGAANGAPQPAVTTAPPAAATAATQQTVTTPTEPSSPLDTHKTFWDNLKDAQGKEITPAADPTTQSIYNFDPAKVSESAKNLNFVGNLPAELITEALGGGEKAAPALLALINQATQNAVAAMTVQTGKLINDGITTNNERVRSTLPRHIKQVQLDQTSPDNPVLSHPAAAPLVAAMKKAAFSRDPNADPAAVTKAVESLLTDFAAALTENSASAVASKAQAAAGTTDWLEYAKS